MVKLTLAQALKHILADTYPLESELRRGEVINAYDRLLRIREYIERHIKEDFDGEV